MVRLLVIRRREVRFALEFVRHDSLRQDFHCGGAVWEKNSSLSRKLPDERGRSTVTGFGATGELNEIVTPS